MKSHLFILYIFFTSAFYVLAESGELTVREVSVEEIRHELPLSINLQALVVVSNSKEWNLPPNAINIGSDPTSFIKYFKCSDGVEFLIDNIKMALWYRATKNSDWVCLLMGVHINKTFGGVFPYLPVQYMGDEKFVYAESLRLRTQKSDTDGIAEPTEYRTHPSYAPYAYCVTYLIDASNGKLLDRTKKYEYDHNPRTFIPVDWFNKYKLAIKPNKVQQALVGNG